MLRQLTMFIHVKKPSCSPNLLPASVPCFHVVWWCAGVVDVWDVLGSDVLKFQGELGPLDFLVEF